MADFHSNAIYWVDTGKIAPNPFQPRREFDQDKLQALADSIKQYGVLQPLVVTRKEEYKEDGGMSVAYELIAGERRLRASKLAGVLQVPVVIRAGEETDNVKLELAIIENLQREDLNPVDKARAFQKLHKDFGYTHAEIGKKMGRSRVYVSNTLRLLQLPDEMIEALRVGQMSEGHTRPLLMLTDRPQEQQTLFKEIVYKKITVRDSEAIARRIAKERARKYDRSFNPEVVEIEEKISETLGTRVRITPREVGGKVVIDFNSTEDLENLMVQLQQLHEQPSIEHTHKYADIEKQKFSETTEDNITTPQQTPESETEEVVDTAESEMEDELYSISNFSI